MRRCSRAPTLKCLPSPLQDHHALFSLPFDVLAYRQLHCVSGSGLVVTLKGNQLKSARAPACSVPDSSTRRPFKRVYNMRPLFPFWPACFPRCLWHHGNQAPPQTVRHPTPGQPPQKMSQPSFPSKDLKGICGKYKLNILIIHTLPLFPFARRFVFNGGLRLCMRHRRCGLEGQRRSPLRVRTRRRRIPAGTGIPAGSFRHGRGVHGAGAGCSRGGHRRIRQEGGGHRHRSVAAGTE